MAIRDFYRGTTKIFELKLSFNNEVPNIQADKIKIILKKSTRDTDEEAVLLKEADTFTYGEEGKAVFELTSEETNISAGTYYYEIAWYTNGENDMYILESDRLQIKERRFD